MPITQKDLARFGLRLDGKTIRRDASPGTVKQSLTIALPPGNKTERAYAAHLRAQMALGQVRAFWFNAMNLRLADKAHGRGVWYRTDFLVQMPDGGFELHEVKGHMRDDAAVKLAWVAQHFPWPVFVARRQGTGWSLKRVER